ncbi:MAG: phosphate ABC transporter permease subunit PstC [Candidatus Altiarchaeales archaeon ex4484_96]|nr:MAG: phosphate ABC transporter permease subunit PstC [Candidatus Altiarchaeales archaeon ex4484_96]
MNNQKKEEIVKHTLFIFSTTASLLLILIIVFLFNEAGRLFTEISILDFLLGTEWNPGKGLYGAFPFMFFSLIVTAGALLIAIPLGVSCAIFLAEIAPSWARDITRPVIELLAGIPSIIYGLFGLVIIVRFVKITLELATGETLLVGSIILAIMILPIIISISQDSIESVPGSFKKGSLAMGATEWQTLRKIIIPAALPGIFAGVILGVGRAIGETMAVVLVLGNSENLPHLVKQLLGEQAAGNVIQIINQIPEIMLKPGEALTSAILLEMGPAEVGGIHYSALFAMGVLLFIITFILSVSSNIILSKSQINLK